VGDAVELQNELETFFDALISTLPPKSAGALKESEGKLKNSLFELCKLDSPDDEARITDALKHTRQVAEAMEVMTTKPSWERLSAGKLFKHLVREVEEEYPDTSSGEKETKFEEFLSPVLEASSSVDPYQMTLAYTHDLGKLRTRRQHEFATAEMIVRENLLDRMGISEDEALIMEAAIKYHLILPSTFTGSYSLLSFLPVKADPLVKSIEERGLTGRFLDALYLISVADVAGLGKMTKIKIDNFDLRKVLLEAFSLPGSEFEKRLFEIDRTRVMTRLASLRCFNKMELKHKDLLKYMDFAGEAREALLKMDSFGVDIREWEEFLDFLPRMVNFGYSIGFLYTFAATGEDGVPGSQKKISPRLYGLLLSFARLMREKEEQEGWGKPLWEISLINHPGFWDEAFKKLMAWMVKDSSIPELLSPERISYGENEGVKVLTVDFNGLPSA